MSCILRVSGNSLDIDALIAQHSLAVNRKWKKGEPRMLKGRTHSNAGANYIASNADLDQFELQLTDATQFMEKNLSDIKNITSFPGVESATLDFGVALNEGYVAQFAYLPPHFLKLAVDVGVGIEISHYACSDDENI